MTAALLAQIEEMNRKGLNDTIIGETIGYASCVVSHWRRKLGLPAARINRSKKRYVIYDGETTQFIMEGSARECAEYMGIKVTTFHNFKWEFEHGLYKKYEIYDAEEGDIDADFDD